MTNTNSWRSSKAWFNAGKEHFNNAKSSLPIATKQTGINFVVTSGLGAAHIKQTPVFKWPGKIVVAPLNALHDTATQEAHAVVGGERQTVEKLINVAINVGTGIGLYAFSNGITTAGNSLLEGKGITKSFGNGVHATKNTVHNAVWGIGEGIATVVDYAIGSTVLGFEGLGWLYNKAWDNSIGRLPHDEATDIAGAEVADADN